MEAPADPQECPELPLQLTRAQSFVPGGFCSSVGSGLSPLPLGQVYQALGYGFLSGRVGRGPLCEFLEVQVWL